MAVKRQGQGRTERVSEVEAAAFPPATFGCVTCTPVRTHQPVYAHGLTAWPGANRYADWYAAHRRDHGSMPESVPATEQRVRVPALPRQGESPT